MTPRKTSCVELDFTEEDYKAVYKVADMLTDVMSAMVDTNHKEWHLENHTVSDSDLSKIIGVLTDIRSYNVLR